METILVDLAEHTLLVFRALLSSCLVTPGI